MTDEKKQKRGRPQKPRRDALADQAASDLAAIQNVWVQVEVAKRQRPDLSVNSICEIMARESTTAKSRAAKVVREMLDASQKYLFSAASLRRIYYRANSLVHDNPNVAVYCESEIARRIERIERNK